MALTYQISLINVWWKNGGQNNRYFSTLNEQKTYFDSLVIGWSELVNFNLNDNITTTIYFRDKTNRSIENLLKCNYAIIKNPNGNYRYFFVNRIWQDSSNQVGVDLELDDFQSNLLPNQDYLNVYVDRITNPTAIYDSNTAKWVYNRIGDTSILQPIDMNPPKRPTATRGAILKFTNNESLDNWLNENIAFWKYLYVQEGKLYYSKYDSDSKVDTSHSYFESCSIYTGESKNIYDYGCIVQPIYRSSKRIYVKFTDDNNVVRYYKIDEDAIFDLFHNLAGYDSDNNLVDNFGKMGVYGYGFKMSIMPPLLKNLSNTDFIIDANGDLILNASQVSTWKIGVRIFDNPSYCVGVKVLDPATYGMSKAQAFKGIFSGFDVEYTTIDMVFDNPLYLKSNTYDGGVRLLGQEFRSFRLRIGAATFEYDPLKYLSSVNQTTIEGEYTEVLGLGISKIYCRLGSSNIYTSIMSNDYYGIVMSFDMLLPTLSTQWAEFIANNKNYFMQKDWNLGYGFARSTWGNVQNAVNSSSIGEGLAKFGTGLISTTMDYANSKVTAAFREYDLQNAPASLSNANGDPYFMYDVAKFYPHLDLMEAPEDYLKSCNDILEVKGIPYKRTCVFNTLLNKHIGFDYIEGTNIMFNTGVILSEREKDRLNSLFMNGIRLFYYDDYDFTSSINSEVQ